MSTHDYNLANQSGASFRSDLNNALAAILSNNSNASDPSTTVAFMTFADTNANKLKIRNSANDAFIDLINLDGSIARDLQLTGAGANILFDQSDNALEFNDNAKATFGTGADLTISHDGSNSIINDSGVGELQLQRAGNTILSLDGSGINITDPDGSAKVSITGFEGGNANINLIADQGDDNGDQWIISSTASNNNFILYNDESGGNVAKWQLTATGIVVMSNDLQLPDKIVHQGDTDTAIRFPSTDVISFETGGSESFRVANNQSVVVGDTTGVTQATFTVNGRMALRFAQGQITKMTSIGKAYNTSTSAVSCVGFQNFGSGAAEITVFRRDNTNPAGSSIDKIYVAFGGSGLNITSASIVTAQTLRRGNIHNITYSITENNTTAALQATCDDNTGEAQTLCFFVVSHGNSSHLITAL